MKLLNEIVLGVLGSRKCDKSNVARKSSDGDIQAIFLIVFVSCVFWFFSSSSSLAQVETVYVGNPLSTGGNHDGDPPLVILGEFNPAGPSAGSAAALPAGTVQDVRFYGSSYAFTLYALAWVTNGPNLDEQTFQVVAVESFSNSAATAVTNILSVTNFSVSAGDFLAFQGTGPYYLQPATTNGLDATYESLGSGNPYTATNPGSVGTTFTVGLNGDMGAGYEYIPSSILTLPSRTYAFGADVLTTNGYTFVAIAGQPTNGFADGLGTNSLFNNPQSTAVAPNFDVFLADTFNNRIRKISTLETNWIVTAIAGTNIPGSADGAGTNAAFDLPEGIAVTPNETVFVADTVNDTIRMITNRNNNTWVVSTIAGTVGVTGTNDGTNVVGRLARFDGPEGICVDSHTNLFVTDTTNETIREITFTNGNWVVSTIDGLPGFSGALDGSGQNARFFLPEGIAVDAADNVYVTDAGNNKIRKITQIGANWVVSTIAGSTNGSADGTGTNASFNDPGGIAVDTSSNLYVADTGNDTIRKMTLSGAIWAVNTIGGLARNAGYVNGTGPAARFTSPRGISVNWLGDLFVDGSDTSFGGSVDFNVQNAIASSAKSYMVQVLINPAATANNGAQWKVQSQDASQPSLTQSLNASDGWVGSGALQGAIGTPIDLYFSTFAGWTAPNGASSGGTTINPVTQAVVVTNLTYTPLAWLVIWDSKLWITGTVNTAYNIQYDTSVTDNKWQTIVPAPWTNPILGNQLNYVTNWPPPMPLPVGLAPAAFYRAKWTGN